MRCQKGQTRVACMAVSVWLLSLCVLSVGCARSISRSIEDEKDKSDAELRDSGDESDADDSLPPSHKSDSGQRFEPDAGRDDTSTAQIECRYDSECPSANPCEQGVCSRSGFCATVSLPDGEDCSSSNPVPVWRICLDGVCQDSRCGDAFVDRLAGESCDDGNSDTGDACVMCTLAFCGDGYIQRGVENCEPGISEDPCNEECRISDSPQWTVVPQPELQMAMFTVLLLDSSGNPIIVAAGSESTVPSLGTRIYKYQNNGDRSWTLDIEDEVSVTAALDDNDNIVVAGGTADGPQPWLAKIDSDGEQLWSLDLASESMLVFAGVATDDEADIMALMVSVATPPTMSTPSLFAIWLGRTASLEFISADGDYDSDSATEIEGNYTFGCALNSATIGGVDRYLVAGAIETVESNAPFLTLVESKGEPVWDAPISDSVPDEHAGLVKAVATSDGDIVVLGVSYSEITSISSSGFPGDSSIWLERYSPEGEPRWDGRKRVRFDNPLSIFRNWALPVAPVAMAIDGQDNIFISAYNSEQEVIEGYLSIDKYDSDGEPVWKRPLRHESPERRFPTGLAVDDSGAIYLLAADSDLPFPTPVSFQHTLSKFEQPD